MSRHLSLLKALKAGKTPCEAYETEQEEEESPKTPLPWTLTSLTEIGSGISLLHLEFPTPTNQPDWAFLLIKDGLVLIAQPSWTARKQTVTKAFLAQIAELIHQTEFRLLRYIYGHQPILFLFTQKKKSFKAEPLTQNQEDILAFLQDRFEDDIPDFEGIETHLLAID
jgi:hypothetical protein